MVADGDFEELEEEASAAGVDLSGGDGLEEGGGGELEGFGVGEGGEWDEVLVGIGAVHGFGVFALVAGRLAELVVEVADGVAFEGG